MHKLQTISILHVLLLTMTFIGLKNHVTILPAILITVGRDGWISVILGAFFVIPLFWFLITIQKKSGQARLDDWLLGVFGKKVGLLLNFFIALFLFIIAAFTLREALLWINTTFLPKTPMAILLVLFSVVIIFFVCTSLETIVIFNVFVLFGVIVLGFFVAFVNIQVKDYELLLPILEHGIPSVAFGALYPMSGFAELSLLLFLQHQMKGPLLMRHYLLMLFLLTGLTLGPLIGAITEFGPTEAAQQRYPAYEEWGLATIGRFIEHLDFFSFYQWMTGAFIRVSVLLYIVTLLLKIEQNKKAIWRNLAYPFFATCLLLSLIRENTFLNFHERYFLLITLIGLLFITCIFWIAALTWKPKAKDANEN